MCDSIYGKCPEQTDPQGQSGFLVARGWGEGRRVIANGEGVSIWEDEDVLELARSGGCKTL